MAAVKFRNWEFNAVDRSILTRRTKGGRWLKGVVVFAKKVERRSYTMSVLSVLRRAEKDNREDLGVRSQDHHI